MNTMTDEQKQLLLQDLGRRLLHEVKVNHFGTTRDLLGINQSAEIVEVGYDFNDYEDSAIEDIKPYLRPMSDMTEEEEKEFLSLVEGLRYNTKTKDVEFRTDKSDWLDKKMFDYRGLIPMGLALPALEGMYNN